MQEKVILITGSSSGIGKITAMFLAQQGYKVYASMRNISEKNQAAAQELEAIAGITPIEIDVTIPETIHAAVDKIMAQEGKIDVLINNAGGGGFGLSEAFSLDNLRFQFELNVFGVFSVTKAVLPHMRKARSGLVINVSSVLGRFTAPYFSIYCSSKFALEALSEAWSYEWEELGVESVLIEPGMFPSTNYGANMHQFNPKPMEGLEAYGAILAYPKRLEEQVLSLQKEGTGNPTELVAEKMAEIIAMPNGTRAIRYGVDPDNGHILEPYNQQTTALQKSFLKAFGFDGIRS